MREAQVFPRKFAGRDCSKQPILVVPSTSVKAIIFHGAVEHGRQHVHTTMGHWPAFRWIIRISKPLRYELFKCLRNTAAVGQSRGAILSGRNHDGGRTRGTLCDCRDRRVVSRCLAYDSDLAISATLMSQIEVMMGFRSGMLRVSCQVSSFGRCVSDGVTSDDRRNCG